MFVNWSEPVKIFKPTGKPKWKIWGWDRIEFQTFVNTKKIRGGGQPGSL